MAQKRHPLFYVWCNMKKRCNGKSPNDFERYFARGISYDPSWETFSGFLQDMENGYEPGLQLDRIDNNGNYCKENCRWTDKKTQMNNMSTNRKFTINGITKNLSEWIETSTLKIGRASCRERV